MMTNAQVTGRFGIDNYQLPIWLGPTIEAQFRTERYGEVYLIDNTTLAGHLQITLRTEGGGGRPRAS